MLPETPSPWLNLKAAAKYADPNGCRSPRFIAREIKAGRLKGVRVGGRAELFTTPQWIDAWYESQVIPAPVPFRRRLA